MHCVNVEALHSVLETLIGAELNCLRCSDPDQCAGLRISPRSRLAATERQAPNSRQNKHAAFSYLTDGSLKKFCQQATYDGLWKAQIEGE